MASTFPVALVSPELPIGPNPSPVCLGVLASGSGSNFEAVATAIASGQINARIGLLIYNNPGAKVVDRAARLGVPVLLLNHRDYGSREDLDRAIVAAFQAQGVDWVIMAGWMRIVTAVMIEAFPLRMINVHPSLLPSFKGAKAIEQAIEAQVTITGCTVHLVTLEMDSGPILAQAAVPVLAEDTAESLHQRVQVQEHRLLPGAILRAISFGEHCVNEGAG
jgi:phosphoribosylglycinamide formyltransferase 1